jgi:hypothetical protein
MEDIIDIIVTETTNTIEITAQPNDEIIDVNIIDNREDITFNVTPTVVEVNINTLTGYFGVNWGDIDGTLSNQTDLQNALNLKADLVGGKVPSSQLPSYVDDVIEVANFASLPVTGETGKIYITLNTNLMYRWSGSTYVEIKDSSAVWGAITGTLSSQTDLQNALNAKFDDPTGDTTQYIAGDGSLISFPIAGQAGTLVREVRNTTGATLTKGTIVYISGATGNKPTVSKAIATGDATSAQTFGMCQANIANNSNGYVVCVGDLTGLDTSGLTEGNQLYLSSTTAGTYTTTKQLAPNHLVYIGVVTRAHPTQGQIEVNIQNGYELYELHDVSITSEANNDGLFYEASTDLWKNKSIATVLGGTPVTGSGTINTIPKFTAASVVGNSNITDSGTLITLGSDTYLNGALSIGVTPTINRNLLIQKNLTGSTVGISVYALSTIQSDVTSQAAYFRATSSTQAATFTLTNLYNFTATQATFGAGSTVTNQFGYFASATLIGATNNYGFYGDIPSGSNRWNIYMDGTANNYLNGALGIGQTSLTSRNLSVSRNISGATTAYGIVSDGTIQSDVTSSSAYYLSSANTIPASFTLTNLYHYLASQSTIGVGSVVTNQYGYNVSSNLIGATNNYAFYANIASGIGRWNLFMNGTADNYLAGNLGIGVASVLVSSGPILTTTLTNGGSGYVDGTYTDVASSQVSSNGFYSLFTIIVSGGVVTSATLTWGGTTYRANDTLTVSNTLLGGSGSGLVITVNTVDSSQLTIAGANGGDITLYRNDTSSASGENIGTIKWESRDSSLKSSGIGAEIGAFSAGTAGGAYLSFFTRSISAGTPIVEAMRIDSRGGVGIGATVIFNYNLRASRNITGSTTSVGIAVDGAIQSDVTSNARIYSSQVSTADTSFTLSNLIHYYATNVTKGAASTITDQFGFYTLDLTSATNNYGFYGLVSSGTNKWNLYMSGTANNYLAGSLGVGTTTIGSQYRINTGGSITGATNAYGIGVSGNIASDVTSSYTGFTSGASTVAASFTLSNYFHFRSFQNTIGAGSTVTNQYSFYADPTTIGATNNYGFFGGIASGTNRWNLYMNGTANNYLAGSLGIGVTNPSPSSLVIAKILTGTTSLSGVIQYGTIQSDVTSAVFGFRNDLYTQAASFTLTDYHHFIATQQTIGAGSIVTNQYGYFAQGTLIGATNNYGFFGAIPSGTNRWNLYMNGTANNYMAGSLGIGSTTLAGYGLRVSKNITGATTAYGIRSDGFIQSDVTSEVTYFQSVSNTSAPSPVQMSHYRASQGTIAGGNFAVTVGFYADSTLTNGTNLYGFQGSIAAASNKFNLFMDGTATNYLKGALLIGSNHTTLNACASLQIDSLTQGVLFPRMTTVQKVGVSSPVAGLVVYDTTLNKLCVYTASGWQTITST